MLKALDLFLLTYWRSNVQSYKYRGEASGTTGRGQSSDAADLRPGGLSPMSEVMAGKAQLPVSEHSYRCLKIKCDIRMMALADA